jgi:cellulose synthase/poly-beta-1,6-N-acetylglucosamine synthase-like glycosyltransferase
MADPVGSSSALSDPSPGAPGLSVVVPLYNEEGSLHQLVEKLLAALRPLGLSFELVLVDDGSRDATDLGSFVTSNVLENIRRVRGVGETQLLGTEYAMRIWISPYRLAAFGLSPGDVVKAIRSQNVQLATGELGGLPAPAGAHNSAWCRWGWVNQPLQK